MQIQATQIHATNLTLSAGRGPVYGPLTFHLAHPLTVLRGDPGSGRTSLLLTLAGRMKHDAGSLTVGGHQLPRSLRTVQKLSAIAGFTGIDDLEESVSVAATLRERLAWNAPWWAIVRAPNDAEVTRLCATVFGEEPIPLAKTVIWDLSETQKFLLRLTVALMNKPQLLLVDDMEQLRSTESRAVVWGRLDHISGGRTAVVVSASSLDEQLWAELEMTPHIIELGSAEGAVADADGQVTEDGVTAQDTAEDGLEPAAHRTELIMENF